MPDQPTENSPSTNAGPWPWPNNPWIQRIEGIEEILKESITIAQKLKEERQDAMDIPDSQGNLGGGSDYDLLPRIYQEGELARLFTRDSELERIHLGQGLLENMAGFVQKVKAELREMFDSSATSVFSESYIYSQLLSRLSTDINIAQQALLQRRLNPTTNRITHQGYVLQVAGVITNAALSRVRMSGLLPLHVMPLTYLQDRIDIRLIPYYDVVILSIPYGAMNSTCDRLATDYLAIPHEIGHYLFWWGEFVAGRRQTAEPIREFLEKETAEEPGWVKAWLEEMFADAVGCLIAGPVSVLGFQELLTSSSPYDLLNHFHDDHAHPFPSLRPFIQTALLRKLNRFNSAADALDENWRQWVAENWPGVQNPLQQIYLVGGGELLSGDQIIAHLDRENGPLDQILKPLVSLHPVHENRCWTGNQSLEEIYESFTSGRFMEKVKIEPAELPQRSQSIFIRDQRMTPGVSRLKEIFGGWSTEGPKQGDPGI